MPSSSRAERVLGLGAAVEDGAQQRLRGVPLGGLGAAVGLVVAGGVADLHQPQHLALEHRLLVLGGQLVVARPQGEPDLVDLRLGPAVVPTVSWTSIAACLSWAWWLWPGPGVACSRGPPRSGRCAGDHRALSAGEYPPDRVRPQTGDISPWSRCQRRHRGTPPARGGGGRRRVPPRRRRWPVRPPRRTGRRRAASSRCAGSVRRASAAGDSSRWTVTSKGRPAAEQQRAADQDDCLRAAGRRSGRGWPGRCRRPRATGAPARCRPGPAGSSTSRRSPASSTQPS